MDKRTILALVLSALVLFTFQFYIAKNYPAQAPGTVTRVEETGEGTAIPRQPLTREGVSVEGRTEGGQEIVHSKPVKEVEIQTDKYVVTLSNEGGYIKSIILKEYQQAYQDGTFKVVAVENPEEGIFNIEGLAEWNLSRLRYDVDERGKEVTFSAQLKNGLEVAKRYILRDGANHIDMELYIRNPSTETVLANYSIVAASNIDIPSKIDRRYSQIVSDIAGKPRRDSGKKDGLFVGGTVNYTGLQSKYFSVIAKTSTPTQGATLKQIADNNILSSIEIGKFSINPASGISHNFLLYVGPSNVELMEPYGLSSAVSYGFFGGISKVLLLGLRLFHRIFRNWGIAILLLSACVNLILFPLSRKSYESMKKVQELQPHMDKLRSEHKDNPHKLNKEMMELYKKYNVNPMGGCLPLLLQMPIFIALYQALMRSLELRGSAFLWIRDLSMPDAVRLPFSIPLIGNTLNILPVLMAGAMLLQQRAASRKSGAGSPQAKQQQQMMIMMPVLFLFIMYNFPSGLVLYWLTNTVLTMFEQRSIMHS